MSSEKITFIQSNFGIENKIQSNSHPVAIYQYRTYWWKEENADKSARYACSQTKGQKCTSIIKIKGDAVVCETGHHFCQMLDEADVKCMESEQALKKMVLKETSKTIRACYNEIIKELVCMHSRNEDERQRRVYFQNLKIEGEYTETVKGDLFLRFDNQSEENRIIIFVDNESLKILSESKYWLMDGTFKCAPKNLEQLFTIHALFNNIAIACCYILSKKRDESVYREIFACLKDLALSQNILLNPKNVMADFEMASTKAFTFHFPDVE
ncbi:unnamed protein product, partial [Brachionus calyciflorus]